MCRRFHEQAQPGAGFVVVGSMNCASFGSFSHGWEVAGALGKREAATENRLWSRRKQGAGALRSGDLDEKLLLAFLAVLCEQIQGIRFVVGTDTE